MIEPAAFDILGIGVFGFIALTAGWALKTRQPLPRWVLGLLLAMGILGFLIDGVIVYLTYLHP